MSLSDVPTARAIVARAARRLLSETITYSEFLEALPESKDDSEIEELLDLIEHEPKRAGMLGASEAVGQDHRARIVRLIDALES